MAKHHPNFPHHPPDYLEPSREDHFAEEPESHYLTDAMDNLILMHRDAHFGGKFEFMQEYYDKAGKGIVPDFEPERIRYLAEIEKQKQENLAAILLSGAEAERVAEARNAYKKLRDLYEIVSPKNKRPRLIADLILSEEDDPQEEIVAIVAEKGEIVSELLDLLRAEDFYDPLFPGYGKAPTLAAHCLGLIGDRRAIISLFESMGGDRDFFTEDVILQALKAMGNPAKEFLLKVLKGRPLNEDNEKAAIALIQFKEDPDVSSTSLKLLQDKAVRQDLTLSTYLALICEGLRDLSLQEEFLKLSQDPSLSPMLRQDMVIIGKTWKK